MVEHQTVSSRSTVQVDFRCYYTSIGQETCTLSIADVCSDSRSISKLSKKPSGPTPVSHRCCCNVGAEKEYAAGHDCSASNTSLSMTAHEDLHGIEGACGEKRRELSFT